jgi:hypothetical protein
MFKFLKNIFVFVSILILYFTINFIINRVIIERNSVDLQFSTLIMGDSHVMTSLNDKLLPNSLNISQDAESYPVTYFKLRSLATSNKIDTVILGFAVHNISDFNDQKFSNRFWSDELFNRIYPITTFNDFKAIEINYWSYTRSVIKNLLLYPKGKHNTYLGKFKVIKKQLNLTKQKPELAINRHFYPNNKEAGTSQLSLSYLDSLMELCKEKHINIIFINTPIHPEYEKRIPEKIYLKYNEIRDNLVLEGYTVLNYSKIYTRADYFADYDHLNNNGATIFSYTLKMNPIFSSTYN